jgi:tetratricopeptide (TPR) repeat protein
MLSNSSVDQQGHAPGEPPEKGFPLNIHQLPPPPGDFTGRKKDIEEVVEKVKFDGASIVGLFGMGGIGKTALGLRVAEELIPRYTDAQIYLDLRGTGGEPLSPCEVMEHVIRAYDPGFPEGHLGLDIDGYYRSVLSGRRAIIFLDDVSDREQVLHLIPPAGCLLLITSRKCFALPGLFEKDMNALTAEEAGELLLRASPKLERHANEIAALCSRLPAALRKAANLLVEHRDLTVETLLCRLSQPDARRALVDALVEPGYERLSPDVQRMWRCISVFPGKFEASDAAEIWGIDQGDAQDLLSVLVSCSMLEWDGTDPGYRMHELFRLSAEARCTDEERRVIRKKLSDSSAMIFARAGEFYLQGGEGVGRGLGLFDRQRLFIESGWRWASAHAEQDVWAERLCVRFPVSGGDILDIRQTPAERIRCLQAPLAAARRLKDADGEAILLRDAGTAYYNLGDIPNSIEANLQALAAARESGNRKTEAGALAGLGQAYARNGDLLRAEDHLDRAIAVSREIGDRRGECHAMSCLVRTHLMKGDVGGVTALCEEALTIARETGDLRAEARVLGDLASASLALGNAHGAIALGSQSLQYAREIGDRQQEGIVLDTMGTSYSVSGNSQRAIECHESGLRIARELSDRYGEGEALGNMANALARSGDARRALGRYQELLKLVRDLGDRRGEAMVLGNIGKARARLGDTRLAIACHAERLNIAREIGDRGLEGSALWNMSLANERLGDHVQAVSHAEAARKIFEREGNAVSARLKKQLSERTQRTSRPH